MRGWIHVTDDNSKTTDFETQRHEDRLFAPMTDTTERVEPSATWQEFDDEAEEN
jgi:hypothetical protein